MNFLRARVIVVAGSLLVCPLVQAQSETPAGAVQKTPERTTIRIGTKSYGELATWKITDFKSPYFGLTLVWLELRESKTLVSVEKAAGGVAIQGTFPPDTFAVLSGGTWTGAYDLPSGSKSASGLVIASGTSVSAFSPQGGGVLVACKDDLDLYDAAAYGRKYPQGTVSDCPRASALQTTSIVMRKGQPVATRAAGERANRLAIGKGDDHVIIAGAFTAFGSALTLADFTGYVAAAAKKMGRDDLTALNLDGACSAQLYIPPINRRFGCDKPGYSINRIVLRHDQ